MQPTNVFSRRTKRIVAKYNQDNFSQHLERELINSTSREDAPQPLADSILHSIFGSPTPDDENNIQPQSNNLSSLSFFHKQSTSNKSKNHKKKKFFSLSGMWKKMFRRKEPIRVNLNDYSSVSSKDSGSKADSRYRKDRKGPTRHSTRDSSTIFPLEYARKDSAESLELSGSSLSSNVLLNRQSSVLSNASSDQLSAGEERTTASEVSTSQLGTSSDEQYQYPMLPSTNSQLRMTFSRDSEDEIRQRILKGDYTNPASFKSPRFSDRPKKKSNTLISNPKDIGMMKLNSESDEYQSRPLPALPEHTEEHRGLIEEKSNDPEEDLLRIQTSLSSQLTSHPTESSSYELAIMNHTNSSLIPSSSSATDPAYVLKSDDEIAYLAPDAVFAPVPPSSGTTLKSKKPPKQLSFFGADSLPLPSEGSPSQSQPQTILKSGQNSNSNTPPVLPSPKSVYFDPNAEAPVTSANPPGQMSAIQKMRSEKNLKRAKLSTRMSRSFMVRPGSQYKMVSPLNRVPSVRDPIPSVADLPILWRPTSHPVLTVQPQVQLVPRYNSTSALPTTEPSEEFMHGLPYQPGFQSFYAKSFYIPRQKPTVPGDLPPIQINPISLSRKSSLNRIPSGNFSREPAPTFSPPRSPLNRRRYDDAHNTSQYGEVMENFNLSQYFSVPAPPLASSSNPVDPIMLPPVDVNFPYPPPAGQNTQVGPFGQMEYYDAPPTFIYPYSYDIPSDISEDHSWQVDYRDLQRREEQSYNEHKRRTEIEKMNEHALQEAMRLSMEEERSVSSNRTRKYEEIERANEEALRFALLMSMHEVQKSQKHSSPSQQPQPLQQQHQLQQQLPPQQPSPPQNYPPHFLSERANSNLSNSSLSQQEIYNEIMYQNSLSRSSVANTNNNTSNNTLNGNTLNTSTTFASTPNYESVYSSRRHSDSYYPTEEYPSLVPQNLAALNLMKDYHVPYDTSMVHNQHNSHFPTQQAPQPGHPAAIPMTVGGIANSDNSNPSSNYTSSRFSAGHTPPIFPSTRNSSNNPSKPPTPNPSSRAPSKSPTPPTTTTQAQKQLLMSASNDQYHQQQWKGAPHSSGPVYPDVPHRLQPASQDQHHHHHQQQPVEKDAMNRSNETLILRANSRESIASKTSTVTDLDAHSVSSSRQQPKRKIKRIVLDPSDPNVGGLNGLLLDRP